MESSDSERAAKTLANDFTRHHQAVLDYCRRRASFSDAEDAAAEVMAIAWRRRADVPSEYPLAYLYGVAFRVLANQRRSVRRSIELARRVPPDHPETPDEVVVVSAEAEEVLAALLRLRSADQEIIRLATWEELSRAEIAVSLGCSENAVTKRLNRALDRLARAARCHPGRRDPHHEEEEQRMNRRRDVFERVRASNPVPSACGITEEWHLEGDSPRARYAIGAAAVLLAVALIATFVLPATGPQPTSPTVGVTDSRAPVPELGETGWIPTRFVLGDGTVLAETAGGSVEVPDGYEQIVLRAIDRLLDLPELGATRAERSATVLGCPPSADTCHAPEGGLVVTLTIEPETQQIATGTLDRWVTRGEGQAGEIVVVDNQSAAVRAWVATDPVSADHPAGTLMHTFIALAALDEGFGFASEWDASSPRALTSASGDPVECSNAGGNSSDVVTLGDALVLSVNTVFCDVAATVGESNVQDMMERLGVSSAPGVGSLMLGTNRIDPIGVAGAYGMIARYGRQAVPEVVATVKSAEGRLVWEPPSGDDQVLPAGLVAATHQILAEATESGTATQARIGSPQGGKTGSTADFVGAWYAGYTPQTTAVVWVGNTDDRPLVDVVFGDRRYTQVFGGTVPAPIWAELMRELGEHESGAEFPTQP